MNCKKNLKSSAQSMTEKHQGKKYNVFAISEEVNLFLRSRNAYQCFYGNSDNVTWKKQ